MKKILIILVIFGIDRITKMYLLNLQSAGTEIDFYVLPFLDSIALFDSTVFSIDRYLFPLFWLAFEAET